MNVTVLNIAIMNHILGDRNLGTTKDRRFVHVVPREQVLGRSDILVIVEVRGPPVSGLGVVKVDPCRTSGPAPAIKVCAAVLVFDVHIQIGSLLGDVVSGVLLDMGVNDGHHLCREITTKTREG